MFMFPMIWFPNDYDLPPTLYAIMNSMVNFDVEEQTKIENLPLACHERIFDFNYPLSEKVDKTDFECMILKHFLMRRIGYDTMTAFKIALDVKLNEIMPEYNIEFDSLIGWDLFNDGETISRTTQDSGSATMTNTSDSVNDNKFSDTPQNRISEVQSGEYVTEYNYATGNSSSNSNSTDSRNTNETINRSPAEKTKIYNEFIKERRHIYTRIFEELDNLFYGLI